MTVSPGARPDGLRIVESRCPLCGGANACARAGGNDVAPGTCWCEHLRIAPEVLECIPTDLQGKCCVCKSCAEAVPRDDLPHVAPGAPQVGGQVAVPPGDTYFTDDGRMVFTRDYHLRRGYCCGSGCRHCPF